MTNGNNGLVCSSFFRNVTRSNLTETKSLHLLQLIATDEYGEQVEGTNLQRRNTKLSSQPKRSQELKAKNEDLEEKLAVAEDLADRVATLEKAVISSLS